MKKIIINKPYFNKLLERRYGAYIKSGEAFKKRCIRMLACEVDCSERTIYHFQNNTYSLDLLRKIIDALDITKEEFDKLIQFKED